MSGTTKGDEDEEVDCGCYAKSHTKEVCPPIRNVTHPLRYYEFSREEIKALEECDRESFYQRCLPLSTIFATMTYAAVRNGYLAKNMHFGSAPKVLIAILFGHVFGRVSYQKECDAKLRSLPGDSYLGNVMRKYHTNNSTQPAKFVVMFALQAIATLTAHLTLGSCTRIHGLWIDVHCWTWDSPKGVHIDRSSAVRIQLLPATFAISSEHLEGI